MKKLLLVATTAALVTGCAVEVQQPFYYADTYPASYYTSPDYYRTYYYYSMDAYHTYHPYYYHTTSTYY